MVACENGYAVQSIFLNDPYDGYLTDEAIKNSLEFTFKTKYRALNLTNLLIDELRGILSFSGYVGPNNNGYVSGTYDKIHQYISSLGLSLIPIEYNKLFVMGGSGKNKIVDINWKFLSSLLFQALQDQKIIKPDPHPTELFDYAITPKSLSVKKSFLEKANEMIKEITILDDDHVTFVFDQLSIIKKEFL